MTEEQMRENLKIDEFSLDEEWKIASSKFMEAAENYTLTRQIVDQYKHEMEHIFARFSLLIREDPMGFGYKGRVTEAVVDNLIEMQPETAKHKTKLRDAVFEMRKAENYYKSMEVYIKSLSSMVHLLSLQYYSEPKCKEGESPLIGKKIRTREIKNEIGKNLNEGRNMEDA